MNQVFLPWDDSLGFQQPVGMCLCSDALNLLSRRVQSLRASYRTAALVALTKCCLEALYTVLVVESPVLLSPTSFVVVHRALQQSLPLHASGVLLCGWPSRSQPTTGNAHSPSRSCKVSLKFHQLAVCPKGGAGARGCHSVSLTRLATLSRGNKFV